MGIVKLRKAQPYNLKINDMGLKIRIGKLILGCGGGVGIAAPSGLDLLFDNIANANIMIGGSSSNVSDWNTFFDLPVKGTPFTSVTVTGNKVTLFGGSGITFRDYVFGDNVPTEDCLLEVVDNVGCIIACEDGVFSDCNTGFGCYGITKIHLSACVTLGKEVFADCLVLVDLNLPLTSYTALGDYCFQNCAELINLNFSSLISAGDGCFSNCSGLVSPDFSALTSAGDNCFYGCTGLVSPDFSALTSAGDNCFSICSGLVSPDFSALTSAGNGCFSICSGLVSPDFSALTSAGDGCFLGCTGLVSPDFSALTSAGNGCFLSCTGLVSPDFSALTSAGDNCFYGCTGLVSPDFSALTSAGDYCFQNCAELINLNFSSLISAGDGCFSNCSGLVSPDFSSLISAGVSCFEHCTELINLDLSSCTSLGTTTGNDNVFRFIIGNIITLTVPVALMICNGGAPDGDIAYLQANNTVTVIQV